MFFREHHSSNLSFGWSGGGGATIVLEDLGADAPATVTRAEFGMCAGHGVRSPTSSKVQEAGPSHGLGGGVRLLRAAFEVAGRLLGVLGMRALSRPAIRHFENSTAGEVSPVCCFDFGLAPQLLGRVSKHKGLRVTG